LQYRFDFTGTGVVFLDPRNTDLANGGANRGFNGTMAGWKRCDESYFTGKYCGTFATALSPGVLGRNVFHGPGDIIFDVSLIKRTNLVRTRAWNSGPRP
jgi:hypothetical protein